MHPEARLEVELVDLVRGIADTEPMPMLRPWLNSRPLLLRFRATFARNIDRQTHGVRSATRSVLPIATCHMVQRWGIGCGVMACYIGLWLEAADLLQ